MVPLWAVVVPVVPRGALPVHHLQRLEEPGQRGGGGGRREWFRGWLEEGCITSGNEVTKGKNGDIIRTTTIRCRRKNNSRVRQSRCSSRGETNAFYLNDNTEMLLLNSPRPGIGSGCDCWSRRSTWLGAPARLRSRRWRKTRWASERWGLTTQEEENGDVKLTNDDKRNTIYELTNTEITFIHVKITASSFTFSACHISLHLWIQLSFLPLHKCFPEATYRNELSALERIHCAVLTSD